MNQSRLAVNDLVAILRNAALAEAEEKKRCLKYSADRCCLIVEAMEACGVTYRLTRDPSRLVTPALLPAEQPEHDFAGEEALALSFDCKGFLPRHMLPNLIVDRSSHRYSYCPRGGEIVWQNGVLLYAGRGLDARALVCADHHERHHPGDNSIWFDRELNPSQRFRATIVQRIESTKAVVVLWTERSVGSEWVVDEAQRGLPGREVDLSLLAAARR